MSNLKKIIIDSNIPKIVKNAILKDYDQLCYNKKIYDTTRAKMANNILLSNIFRVLLSHKVNLDSMEK